MLSRSSLAEKGVESIVFNVGAFVASNGPIRCNSVLEAVKLPAVVADLDSGLTEVDGDAFCGKQEKIVSPQMKRNQINVEPGTISTRGIQFSNAITIRQQKGRFSLQHPATFFDPQLPQLL
jgi:hypothetical protein